MASKELSRARLIRSVGSAKLFVAYRLGELCGQLQAPPATLADARAIVAEVERECRSVRRAFIKKTHA